MTWMQRFLGTRHQPLRRLSRERHIEHHAQRLRRLRSPVNPSHGLPHPPDSRSPGARPSGQLGCPQTLLAPAVGTFPASGGRNAERTSGLESFTHKRERECEKNFWPGSFTHKRGKVMLEEPSAVFRK
jgi:hypothetical protein